jgi:serine/threonine protein kinase
MPLSPGDRLGPYEIVAPVGAGGMGEVWRGRDTRLGRTVAIKISHQQFSERFEREARAVAALNHPNICQLYDLGTQPDDVAAARETKIADYGLTTGAVDFGYLLADFPYRGFSLNPDGKSFLTSIYRAKSQIYLLRDFNRPVRLIDRWLGK